MLASVNFLNDISDSFHKNFIVEDRWKQLLSGLGVTLQITLFAAILGIILGFVIASIRSTHDKLLSDKKGGEIFTLFGAWHFLYIGLTLFTVIAVLLCFKNKNADLKRKATRIFINIGFGLYILDIFLMPLAYGEIDIDRRAYRDRDGHFP